MDVESAATTLPSWIIIAVSKSFPMKYCMTLYLKRYQKYDRSKLKNLLLLSEFRSFNFDILYIWSPFRYKVIQYLIGKLLDMVQMIQEGKVVAALSTSIRTSWKTRIYFINRAVWFSIWHTTVYLLQLLWLHQFSRKQWSGRLQHWKMSKKWIDFWQKYRQNFSYRRFGNDLWWFVFTINF